MDDKEHLKTKNEKYVCPVCDLTISLESEAFVYKHKEKQYLFNSYECKQFFKKNPGKFIKHEPDNQIK